jgi:hypothetical protein
MQKIKTEKEVYVEEGQKKEELKIKAREESEKALKELDMFSDSVSSLIRHTNERINYTNETKNCSVCECPKKKNLRAFNIKISMECKAYVKQLQVISICIQIQTKLNHTVTVKRKEKEPNFNIMKWVLKLEMKMSFKIAITMYSLKK